MTNKQLFILPTNPHTLKRTQYVTTKGCEKMLLKCGRSVVIETNLQEFHDIPTNTCGQVDGSVTYFVQRHYFRGEGC